MKKLLRRYADSIDAMALRERVLIFGAVALVLMTLLQVFLLNPVLSRRNQLSAQIAQQEDETKAIQAQIQIWLRTNPRDQDALNRDKIKSLRAQIVQLGRQFEEQQRQFVAPDRMTAMLENMIAKNQKLQLLSLRNLPSTDLSPAAGPMTGAAPGRAKIAGTHQIFRHTVEISVKGSYFDLLDYLAALERMPQRVFWEGLDLSVAQYPQSVLKLTIYTLSPEKSWLAV
jgi:MSHA biogenesis protein MshJ